MATGQDHYRYGETKPVGLQIVPTLLCWRICQTNGRSTLGNTRPRHRNSAQDGPENPPKAWGKNDWIPGWMAGHLPDTSHTRIGSEGTSSFLYVPQRILVRELYLGLKVTASFDRSESYTRVIDGKVRCITQKLSRRTYRSSGTCSLSLCLSPHGWFLLSTIACVGKASRTRVPPVK